MDYNRDDNDNTDHKNIGAGSKIEIQACGNNDKTTEVFITPPAKHNPWIASGPNCIPQTMTRQSLPAYVTIWYMITISLVTLSLVVSGISFRDTSMRAWVDERIQETVSGFESSRDDCERIDDTLVFSKHAIFKEGISVASLQTISPEPKETSSSTTIIIPAVGDVPAKPSIGTTSL